MQQLQLLQTVDDEKLCPLAWKENINSSKKFLNFFLTNIKKFHVEMGRSGASQEEIINFFFYQSSNGNWINELHKLCDQKFKIADILMRP